MAGAVRSVDSIRPDRVEAAVAAEHPRVHTSPDSNNHPVGIRISPCISGEQGRNNQPHAERLDLCNTYRVMVMAWGKAMLVGQGGNHTHKP